MHRCVKKHWNVWIRDPPCRFPHFYIYFYLKFGERRHTSFFFKKGFSSIFISFIFSYFLLFICFLHFWKKNSFKIIYCISLLLFHLFAFLFYSFYVFTFFLVYVCFMFLFFLFLFCISSFFSIFMYLFIYLFCFYFLFQKDSSFIIFVFPALPCPALSGRNLVNVKPRPVSG
jgi:hypothetical protein